MEKKTYLCFGGYGEQHWHSLRKADIDGKCDGLTVCEFDEETGEMKQVSHINGIDSPATLYVSPDCSRVYAANELKDFGGRGLGGGVSAFAFDADTGKLSAINQSFAYGSSTCYICLDKQGKYILAANHGAQFYCTQIKEVNGKLVPQAYRDEGCISMFRVREDGGIGELADRFVLEGTGKDPIEHASAHPHCILIDEEDFVVVPNKGGDNIYVFHLDRNRGKLDLLSIYKAEFGSSPRHAFFVKGTAFVLVQNEFDAHLCSYRLDRKSGELERISRADTYIADITHNNAMIPTSRPWGLDVQVHPNGRYVYCNNSQNVIVIFELDAETGELKYKDYVRVDVTGMTRGMQIDRNGKYLITTCVLEDKAICYSIGEEGGLEKVSQISVPTPTALRFLYP